MGKSIRDVMTPNPETLEAGKAATDAAKLMKKVDAGMIPVVRNGGELLGTVTDRDIVLRIVAEGKSPETTTVGEIASKEIVTVAPEQDLDEALSLMALHQVRRLPVVDNGRLVGVLAQADVAREGDVQAVGETIEQISR
jgi:CBS domain-containing protein